MNRFPFLKTSIALIVIPIFLYLQLFAELPDPDPLRFAKEINTFTKWDQKNSYPADAILFAGSSSIRLWQTHTAFPKLPIINRGFGGAHISDMLHYYQETIKVYSPKVIIFYCGDNDIAAGKSVSQVLADYIEFITNIKADFPTIRLIYIPVKPSISRWDKWPVMDQLNQEINRYNASDSNLYNIDIATPMLVNGEKPGPELFMDDGLHLNQTGYALWTSILTPVIQKVYNDSTK